MQAWIRISLFSLILVSSAAQAYFFPINPRVMVNPAQITAQVYNPYYEPILCQGYVYGTTYRGLTLNAWFNSILAPGESRYATVYVNNPYFDRFGNGWANISCQFLR